MLYTCLLWAVLALSWSKAIAQSPDRPPWWVPPENFPLPQCPGVIEERHYNIDVKVLNLPETCTDEQLVVVGWLVEDAVEDMEEGMPEYQGEDFITAMCPLPLIRDEDWEEEEEKDDRRQLRSLGRRRTYTYSGSGRCRRCATSRRLLASGFSVEKICSLADETMVDRDRAATAAKVSNKMLAEVKTASSSHFSTNAVILKSKEITSRCNKASYLATVASKAAVKACDEAQNDPDFSVMSDLMKHAEAMSKVAKAATQKAEQALLDAEKVRADLADVLPSTMKAFGSFQKHRDLSSDENDSGDSDDEDSGSGSGDDDSFGIQDVVLVDSETDQDVPGKPLDCQPANACFGSSKMFNFRADTYGDVKRVHISIAGPITESRFESYRPYTLFSDTTRYQKTDYLGKALPPGNYTLTAQALDDDHESKPWVKQFQIGDIPKPTEAQPTETTQDSGTTKEAVSTAEEAKPTEAQTKAQVQTTQETTVTAAQEPRDSETPTNTRRGSTFIQLLISFMGHSSVECASLNSANTNLAIAEESIGEANETLAKIMDMASGYNGSLAVTNITTFSQDVHRKTLDAAISARLATAQTESFCKTATWASRNDRKDSFFEHAEEEARQVGMYAALARSGIFLLREAENDMKELFAAINYNGAETADIEQELFHEGDILLDKIDEIVKAIAEVDAEIKLTTDQTLLASLEQKIDSLTSEKTELERLLATNDEVLSEQMDMKMYFFEEEITPDFSAEDPLQFVARAYGKEKKIATNWDRAQEDPNSKQSWFAKFGNMVVNEIPTRLMWVFNETAGGCIMENTTLLVEVNLTEVPKSELIYPTKCINNVTDSHFWESDD